LDEQTGRIKLSKVMPEGMVFPYDFGFFPGARAQDGNPLDILLLSDEATFPGCQIDCRLLGVLLARQRDKEGKENRNDRIIAVAEASVVYSEVTALADLSPTMLTQIEQFFVNYQKVREIEITVLGRDGQQAAKNLLERALIAGRK
jgi:inorganic pyrophosphatase